MGAVWTRMRAEERRFALLRVAELRVAELRD